MRLLKCFNQVSLGATQRMLFLDREVASLHNENLFKRGSRLRLEFFPSVSITLMLN